MSDGETLTKVEALAGQIAIGLLIPGVLSGSEMVRVEQGSNARTVWKHNPAFAGDCDSQYEARIASHAVNLAEAILAECGRRAAPQLKSKALSDVQLCDLKQMLAATEKSIGPTSQSADVLRREIERRAEGKQESRS